MLAAGTYGVGTMRRGPVTNPVGSDSESAFYVNGLIHEKA